MTNTSLEPVTKWFASLAEDSIVVIAILFAVSTAAMFLVILGVVAVIGMLIPRLVWKGLHSLFRRAADFVRHGQRQAASLEAGAKPAA